MCVITLPQTNMDPGRMAPWVRLFSFTNRFSGSMCVSSEVQYAFKKEDNEPQGSLPNDDLIWMNPGVHSERV